MAIENHFEKEHTEKAWTFFQARLKEAGVETLINPNIELFEFKTGDANTEVMKLPVIFRFPLATRSNVLDRLEKITTNDRINRDISKQTEILDILADMLSNVDIDSLKRDFKIQDPNAVDIFDLFKMLTRVNAQMANKLMELGFFENRTLYTTRQQLKDILGGEAAVNINLEIVYKRIDNASDQIQREIGFYKEFQDAGINTFCAFTFKYIDEENGAYDFTKFEGDLKTVATMRDLFRSNMNGKTPFKVILEELLKTHRAGFMHGDLHFKNIGFVQEEDGRYIILFDLVKASKFNPEDKGLVQKFIGELAIFGQNTLYMARDLALSKEMKAQLKIDLDEYFEGLKQTFPNVNFDYIRDFCFSDLYEFLG